MQRRLEVDSGSSQASSHPSTPTHSAAAHSPYATTSPPSSASSTSSSSSSPTHSSGGSHLSSSSLPRPVSPLMGRALRSPRGVEGGGSLLTAHAPSSPSPLSDDSRALPLAPSRTSHTSRSFADLQLHTQVSPRNSSSGRSSQVLPAASPSRSGVSASASHLPITRQASLQRMQGFDEAPSSSSVDRVPSAESLLSLERAASSAHWHRSAALPHTNGRTSTPRVPAISVLPSSSSASPSTSTHHSPSNSISLPSFSSTYPPFVNGEEAAPSSTPSLDSLSSSPSSLSSGWHAQVESGQRQRQRRNRGDSNASPQANGYSEHRSRARSPPALDLPHESDSASDAGELPIEHSSHPPKEIRRRGKRRFPGLQRRRWPGWTGVEKTAAWWRRTSPMAPWLVFTLSLVALSAGLYLLVGSVPFSALSLALFRLGRSPLPEVTVSFPLVTAEPAVVRSRATLLPATAVSPVGNSSLPVFVIASCANRLSSLQSCLPTWLAVPEVSSIVIVDWASQVPLHESLHETIEEADGRLRVVRLEHPMAWELASSVNLALHFIPTDKPSLLLKVDCDTLLLPNFVVNHPLTPDRYYAGDWRLARNENEMHLNGVLFLHTDAFVAVNGYDERLQSYGYDDTNLHERLNAIPLHGLPLRYDYVQHLWHDDSVRAVEEKDEAKRRQTDGLTTALFNQLSRLSLEALLAVAPPFFATQRHRVLLDLVPRWSTSMTGAQFTVHQDYEQPHVYFTRMSSSIPALEEQASPANQTRAINEAAQIALRRLGFRVDQLSREQYSDSKYLLRLLSFYYTDSEGQSLVVEVQHGLSNRLRALASALAVAAELKLHLKVIWLPDHHCQARFSDLFRLPYEVGQPLLSKDVHPIVRTLQQLRPQLVWEDSTYSPAAHLLSTERFDVYNYMEQEGGKKDARIPAPVKEKSLYIKSAYRLNHDAGLTDFNLCKALGSLILSDRVTRRMNVTAPDSGYLTTQMAQAALPELASMIGVHIRHQPPGKEIAELKPNEYSKQAWNALAEARNLTDINAYDGYIRDALKDNPEQRFYVSTDTPAIAAELNTRYEGKMESLSSHGCLNRSVDCVQHALADQLLLGSTKRILGSVWSSFSEMAGLWKQTPVVYPAHVDSRVNALAAGKPIVEVAPNPAPLGLNTNDVPTALLSDSPFLSPALLRGGVASPPIQSRALSLQERLSGCVIRKISLLGERCSGTTYLQRLLEANFNLSITHEYHYKHFFGFEDPKHPLSEAQCTLFVGIVREPIAWLDSLYKYQWQLDQWRYPTWGDFLTQPIISYVESEMNHTLLKIPEQERAAMHAQMLQRELWHDRNFAHPELPNWKNIFELRREKLRYQLHSFPSKVQHYVLIRLEDVKPHLRTILGLIQSWFNVKRRRDPFIDAQMDEDILWAGEHGQQAHIHASDAVVDYAWTQLDEELEAEVDYHRSTHSA